MPDQQIRAALDQHWAASDANDFETEHRIYHEDAVLEYPQASASADAATSSLPAPSSPTRSASTSTGSSAGDLWVTEFILSYDNKPSYTVSIIEFRDNKVAQETQYFADPFEASPARALYVARIEK